ncbi:MAG: hypothetical protein IJR03_02735 [Bacteroidales bacterium]|nr:hypothetical protein [Bacteroidales bacterium]
MRKKLIFFICLAVCLQTIAFAQMQGIITNSSERFSRAIQPEVNTIKVEKLDNENIITLCRESNISYFCKTTLNSSTVDYGIIPQNLDVYDFKIYKDYIIMCGSGLNSHGFIGVVNAADLFSGTGQLGYYEVDYTIVVYDLECYIDVNNHLKVMALGYDLYTKHFLIDYDLSDMSTPYYLYLTSKVLYRMAQTDNYISIVFSEPSSTEFGVIRHDKNNISNYQSQIWRFAGGTLYSGHSLTPQDRGTYFLIENIDNTDEVCVATAVRSHPPYTSGGVPIVVYNVDVSSLSLNSTQVIQTYGKTKLKDMEYTPIDNTLHIINKNDIFSIDSTNPNSWDTTILYSIDVIHRLQVYPTITPYLSEIIIPSNNLEYDDYINSITKYTDNHYIVGGKSSNTSSIYWFDRRYITNASTCYMSFLSNIDLSTATPIGTLTYNVFYSQKTFQLFSCPNGNTLYFNTCTD